MSKDFRIMTLVRREDAASHGVFCRLVDGQPLLLSEDGGRALVSDLHAAPVGHVSDPTHSAQIVMKIKGGEMLLAKTVGRCFCAARSVMVWSEGHEDHETRSVRHKQPENA